ncbi:uncharacterized protein K02A2.6-like [Wyeomyia smithii]|uniref:uncharacterized protein K02A2.6-like n=1 Tax=Wyeomyia smithii TaxID=174621 RepID=UPI0024680B98|nr:uncharacterized protein K02A2.6-like [Wyeomyia smithii]
MRRRNYERHLFRQIAQKPDERFADFVLRLRIQAKRCEFDRYDVREVEDRIIEQIVESCISSELRRQILAKDMSLDEIVSLGTTIADVQLQVRELDRQRVDYGTTASVNKVFKPPIRSNSFRASGAQFFNRTDRVCFACGRRGHLKGDTACRARNAKCVKCGELGHFAVRCLKRKSGVTTNQQSKKIRLVSDEAEYGSKEENIFYAMGRNTFQFKVGGIKIPMIIDSGADVNILDEATWSAAKEAGMKMQNLSWESDRSLRAYASKQPMKIKCMFWTDVEAGTNRVRAKFYVAEKGQRNLLGDVSAKELGVLKVGFDIAAIESSSESAFPKIKGVLIEIPIDQSVQPVQQAYRRAPLALEGKIHDKLQYLMQNDIIEKVNEPSPWVSPVVPVLKQNGDVRLCVDMRRANQAVLRETHPLPVIEEMLASVNGAVKFSKLDVKDAYHQVELSGNSRVITTFLIKYGLFRYKRLMFGVSCAPELFQKVMETIIAGLEGVIVYLDDVVVSGRTQTEHDNRLKALLDRLESYNVLLNRDKCQFNVSSLDFLGHNLSVNGVRPVESRVSAVAKFREPANAAELRSFLGLVTYVGRFIPHLAAKTDPLRQLLRKGVTFQWTVKQQAAFDSIKKEVFQIKNLGFFDPKDVTILVADASPSGLGAVLMQEDSLKVRRVIAYASKSLTDLERKYFHTEKEALALVWAVDRFRLYLQGTRFKLVTDCKPLTFLFSPRSKPCARIERWVLRLQSYSFEIVYEPGTTNIADAVSRLSTSAPTTFDDGDECSVRMLIKMVTPVAVSLDEIRAETFKDAKIIDVYRAQESNDWSGAAKPFKPFAFELCQSAGILLRGERIVIPKALQNRILELSHEGHPGIVVMKRRLRQKVWWPGMDKEVEKFVKGCKECILVSAQDPPEPLKRTTMPDKPWAHIAADFMGPLPSGHNLLVLIDYFSRFIEVIIMREITAKLTVQALHETFCRYGIPETMRTDNGPQFVSELLNKFCTEHGIKLVRTTPYWPQANGEVERANRALKKRLQISQESTDADWRWDLRTYLLLYNSTPHSTTGVAPSALMFGRVLRDKLPSISLTSEQYEDIQDRDRERKLTEAEYADKRRHAQPSSLNPGDLVVAKRMMKENKLASNFSPEELVVVEKSGQDVTLESLESGRILHRSSAHLKKLPQRHQVTDTEVGESNKASKDVQQPEQRPETQRQRREPRKPEHLKDYHLSIVQDI